MSGVRVSELKCPPFLSELQMEDDSIYNMSQNRGYSVPPPLPITCNAEPSELYRVSVSLEASFAQIICQFNPPTFVPPCTCLTLDLLFDLRLS